MEVAEEGKKLGDFNFHPFAAVSQELTRSSEGADTFGITTPFLWAAVLGKCVKVKSLSPLPLRPCSFPFPRRQAALPCDCLAPRLWVAQTPVTRFSSRPPKHTESVSLHLSFPQMAHKLQESALVWVWRAELGKQLHKRRKPKIFLF